MFKGLFDTLLDCKNVKLIFLNTSVSERFQTMNSDNLSLVLPVPFSFYDYSPFSKLPFALAKIAGCTLGCLRTDASCAQF